MGKEINRLTGLEVVQLELARRREGWTRKQVQELDRGNWLLELLENIRAAEIHHPFINLSKRRRINNLRLESQVEGSSIWRWNPDITLYQHPEQEAGCIGVQDLVRYCLSIGLPILNANALDYLLEHYWLIPEYWKQFHGIFFIGTVYQSYKKGNWPFVAQKGEFLIRGLCWSNDSYHWEEVRARFDKCLFSDEVVALSEKLSGQEV